MKVAVTGASGYLGCSVLRHLANDPAVESLIGLDIVTPRFVHPKFAHFPADVRTADFRKLLEGCDAVCHLAFIVQPPRKMPMSVIDEINVVGSARVFQGAVEAGVPKIIHSSSVAAYGVHADNPQSISEDAPLRPNENWYYSRTKGKVEALLDDLRAKHPETVVIRLRPSIFLGPGIDNSVGKQFSLRWLFCFDIGMKIDLCWVDDVAEAFRLALRHDKSDAFNLSGDMPLSMADLGRLSGKRVMRLPRGATMAMICAAHKMGLVGDGDLEWVRVASRYPLIVSARKAREILKWKPRFDGAGAFREFVRGLGEKRPEAESHAL